MNYHDDVLYVYLHIPKTAGITFMRHVKYNYPSKTVLTISPKPNMKFHHRADVDAYIDYLPQKRKDQIRVVCGHSVYHGIHGHFQKKPRYLTFLRDPVKRAISNFNYFMQNYDVFVEEDNEVFPQSRDELTFDRWWNCIQHNLQTGIVLNYRHDDKPGWDRELRLDESHLEEAKRILDDFYFVGLTETFEEDTLFLYNELNVSRFLKRKQNVTAKRYVEVNKELIEMIRAGAALDIELYEHALRLNREFKRNHPDFSQIVERVRAGRRYVTPIRFFLKDTVAALIGQKRAVMLVERTKKTIGAITRLGD